MEDEQQQSLFVNCAKKLLLEAVEQPTGIALSERLVFGRLMLEMEETRKLPIVDRVLQELDKP